MFIDEVNIVVEAGAGGDGCMAFRREKFVEMGGPFGGNGGRGSNIIFKADEGLNTLIDLRYKKIVKGNNGDNGEGKGRYGHNAENVIVRVPMGTIITDDDTGLIIADLTNNGEEVVVASGGRGGRGNIALASRNNSCPNFCEKGEPGEVKNIKVELKLLADVGLVGMPSVGKSTFISIVSAAKPKIAAYHFTTLKPNLGVVRVKDGRSFVIADLPGLIEGASLGEGLGDRFLKHIERTRVILHIIDMGALEGRDPYQDYQIINKELENFNSKILEKPQVIVANKMDLPDAKENLKAFKEKVKDVPIFETSTIKSEGLDAILVCLADMLDKIKKQPLYEDEKMESHVLYKFKEELPFLISKEGNTWVIKGEKVEKILRMTKFSTDESIVRFASRLRSLGVDNKLRELGATEGDTVRILDYEFEYKE